MISAFVNFRKKNKVHLVLGAFAISFTFIIKLAIAT